MAQGYHEAQLIRFDETERTVGQFSAEANRLGAVVGAGSKAATTDTEFYNVEMYTNEFKRCDVNWNDRFETALPVYVVLDNVAAPAGAGLSAGDKVTVSMRGVVGSESGTLDSETSAEFGYLHVPANQSCIVSSGGGGLSCEQSFYAQGTYNG